MPTLSLDLGELAAIIIAVTGLLGGIGSFLKVRASVKQQVRKDVIESLQCEVARLSKEVQELACENRALHDENEKLRAENQSLRERVDDLESKLAALQPKDQVQPMKAKKR